VLAEQILEGLNPEQREAVTTTEGPLLVLAGAGSGKTRVLTQRVAYLIGVHGIAPEAILAVTFTNKAAGEMRKRVEKVLGPDARAVWMSTFHSVCVRILRREIGHLGVSRGFVIYDDADALGVVKQALARHGLDPKTVDPRRLRWRIDQWKNAGVDPAGAARDAADSDAAQAAEIYATYQRLLADADALDFGDLLMKTVELFDRFPEVLAHYRRRWQYVLVDEYQDTNRVQYRLVEQLAADHRNLCVVGDPDQCLPPHARVQTPEGPRPIGEIRAGDRVIAGSGWGGSATAVVEKVMQRTHRGHLLRVRLRSGRELELTPNHLCFGRLDPLPGMHYVYLMWRRDKGYRLGTTSGVRSSKGGALLNGVMVRTNQEVADAVWIAHACRDLGEARYHEQLYSVRYGIPTMVFHVRGRRMSVDQEWVDRLFDETDSESGAERLMRDQVLDPRFPHHRPFALVRSGFNRRTVWFTMFGDPRPRQLRPGHEHRVQLVTSDPELRRRAEARGFPVREGRKGTWRIETSRKDYDAGNELAESICGLDSLSLVSRARLSPDKPFHFMPASHLKLGMTVPVLDGEAVVEDVVQSVERVPYEGDVYDLSVPALRNFSAEGMVVHNSIYAWRGADVGNILEFERDYPEAVVVKLERNYRSTRPILDGASGVVANNVARKRKELFTDREGGEAIRVFEMEDDREEAQNVVREIVARVRGDGRAYGEFAIFYRTNAQSRTFEEELLKYDVPYVVVGGVRFYDRAEVKDALAYLRLLQNPADGAALRRIVNKPARGIGKTTFERADGLAQEHDVPLLEGLRRYAETDAGARAAPKIRRFLALLDELGPEVVHAGPARGLARVLDRTGYIAALEKEGGPEAESRLENLRELLAAAEDFGRANAEVAGDDRSELELFLDQVALVSDVDQYERRDDRVSLMTVHAAKGLEYPVVYLVGLEEGIFPHAGALRDPDGVEEERRLCYVGMTRAMEQLTITCAAERLRFGSRTYGVPSRFLDEIPPSVVERVGGARGGRRGPGASRWTERAPRRSPGAGDSAYDYSYGQAAPDETGIGPGVRVRHPHFGPGVVMTVAGSGAGQKLKIHFERAGVKTLMVKYANLELG